MPSGHVDRSKPLKPLSDHAQRELRRIASAPPKVPVKAYEVNPGVRDRLFRGGLIEETWRDSFRILLATDAGHAALEQGS